MTLSTNIYVLDEVSPHELFRHCQTLLSKYDEFGRTWRQMACSDKPRDSYFGRPGDWNISNDIGQGLPAILDITYRQNEPLITPEMAAAHTKWCEDDCTDERHDEPCWLDIDFDTAYGYKSKGMGCGDLHAALVSDVGQWLDKRKVRWSWRNEFTGEIHGGEDRYERLVDLLSGGFEATAWFQTTALPAILAHVAEEAPDA